MDKKKKSKQVKHLQDIKYHENEEERKKQSKRKNMIYQRNLKNINFKSQESSIFFTDVTS